jgi:hypothetical protein
MSTQCTQQSFSFGSAGQRKIVGRFDGGHISSLGGVGLLMLTEQITGIIGQLANCFTDYRDPGRIEHTVEQLLRQRLFAMALGYEDLNDHDQLRHDPLLGAAIGKVNPIDDLPAGKSTLNRLELTTVGARSNARYKKIVPDRKAIERLFVDLFIQQQMLTGCVPRQIILDLDATDITLHGDQPGRFYHGYYRDYCYLPLYIYCGEHLLCAKLRPSNIDAARGSVEQVGRIVEQIRTRWPKTQIILRADSGFCREALMHWCEYNRVDYIFGLAKNKRLIKAIGKQLHEAKQLCEATGQASRVFAQLAYKTLKSWSRSRRVVAKAEHLRGDKSNPRFVVTSLSEKDYDSQALYEDMYCPRGEMENRIKEQQLQLFADRLSTTAFRANQLRLWLSAIAYTLTRTLIRLALRGSSWAKIQTATLRQRLLKIGARVRVTVRKIWVSMSSGCPDQALFAQAHASLCRWLI